MDKLKILIVDDEDKWLNILSRHVKDIFPQSEVYVASTVGSALKQIREVQPNIMTIDLSLNPGAHELVGLELIHLRETPCIIVSAWAHQVTVNTYLGNVAGIFPKLPFDGARFKDTLELTAKKEGLPFINREFSAQEIWKMIDGANGLSIIELQKLCFLLEIDDEEFGVSGKGEILIKLLQHLDRTNRLADLLKCLEDEFPHVLQ